MVGHWTRDDLTEVEHALFDLVEALEGDDYRSSSGVLARQTPAFLNAKALISLSKALRRSPWWQS